MSTVVFKSMKSETKRLLEFLDNQRPGFLVLIDKPVDFKTKQWELSLASSFELTSHSGFCFTLVHPFQESTILPQLVTTDQDIHMCFALKFSHATQIVLKFVHDDTLAGEVVLDFMASEVKVCSQFSNFPAYSTSAQLYFPNVIQRVFSYFGVSILRNNKVIVRPLGRERCFDFKSIDFESDIFKTSHSFMKVVCNQLVLNSWSKFRDFEIGLTKAPEPEPL
ncbi:hypothetical protein RCL1_009175 [Eukaryota sp. TZLM3-RCL]